MCFHIDGKYAHAEKCVKYRIMTKVIDCVLSIDTFEQKCVRLKGMLQSPRIKYHVRTIGIDQELSNSALFEHRSLQNIRKLCKNSGKFGDQLQLKDIIEAAMVSTTEAFNDNSPISPMTPTTVNKSSARKSLCIFTNILDVK